MSVLGTLAICAAIAILAVIVLSVVFNKITTALALRYLAAFLLIVLVIGVVVYFMRS